MILSTSFVSHSFHEVAVVRAGKLSVYIKAAGGKLIIDFEKYKCGPINTSLVLQYEAVMHIPALSTRSWVIKTFSITSY